MLKEPPVQTRQQLMERLKELDERIAAVQQWGAMLTALEEERRDILSALNDPEPSN